MSGKDHNGRGGFTRGHEHSPQLRPPGSGKRRKSPTFTELAKDILGEEIDTHVFGRITKLELLTRQLVAEAIKGKNPSQFARQELLDRVSPKPRFAENDVQQVRVVFVPSGRHAPPPKPELPPGDASADPPALLDTKGDDDD